MAKKKSQPLADQKGAAPTPPPELTDLEKIEAEMREISPRLKDLKHNNPEKYKTVYRHYMWLVGERDRLK